MYVKPSQTKNIGIDELGLLFILHTNTIIYDTNFWIYLQMTAKGNIEEENGKRNMRKGSIVQIVLLLYWPARRVMMNFSTGVQPTKRRTFEQRIEKGMTIFEFWLFLTNIYSSILPPFNIFLYTLNRFDWHATNKRDCLFNQMFVFIFISHDLPTICSMCRKSQKKHHLFVSYKFFSRFYWKIITIV